MSMEWNRQVKHVKAEIKQESDSLLKLMTDPDVYEGTFDYTIQVRNGHILRSTLTKVWNGDEFIEA